MVSCAHAIVFGALNVVKHHLEILRWSANDVPLPTNHGQLLLTFSPALE